MNLWIGLGNICNDLKTNQSGKVAYAKLAVQSSEKDDNGRYKSRFIPLRFLGEKTVESVTRYLKKGTKIAVTGETVIEDAKQDDGTYKTFAYVIVRSWEFAQSKSESKESKPEEKPDEFESIPEGTDDVLPFS